MAMSEPTVELELDGVWTDVTTSVRQVSTSRRTRRDRTAARVPEAGSFTIVLNNADRAFDPFVNFDVRPGVGVRVSIDDSGATAQRQFTGKVEDIAVDYPEKLKFSTLTLSGSDLLPRLSRATLVELDVAVGATDTTAERIARILDDISWSGTARDISAGGVELVATTYGGSALQLIADAVDAESGEWWLDKLGRVAFRTLGERLATTTEVTFAADGTGDVKPLEIMPLYDQELLTNRIVYARTGQTATMVEDTSSQSLYTDGVAAVLVDEALPHVDQDDADDWAQLNLLALSTPENRVETVVVRPLGATAVDAVLGLELADKVTVRFQPPGGGDEVVRDAWVAGISHMMTPGDPVDWTTTLTLASASRYNFLRYDDPDATLDRAGFAPGLSPSFTGGRYVAVADELVGAADWQRFADQAVYRFDDLTQQGDEFLSPHQGALIYRADRGFLFFNGTTWLRPTG